MAVRLSKVFGGSAESWLTQQAHYAFAQVRADRIKLKQLELTLGLSSKEKPTVTRAVTLATRFSLFALGRKAEAIRMKVHKWRYNVKASPPQSWGCLGISPWADSKSGWA
jgi:hypothetical protein